MVAVLMALKDVAVMDELVYNALCQYFTVLSKVGYYKWADVKKLLVLIFYRDIIQKDYRGLLTKADYGVIERALNCLYGTTCLIPYPDFMSSGRLHLGEMSEIAQRVKNVENTRVVKVKSQLEVVDDIPPIPGEIEE